MEKFILISLILFVVSCNQTQTKFNLVATHFNYKLHSDNVYPEWRKIDRFGLNYDFIQANNLTWIENLETVTPKAKDKPTDLNDPEHEDHLKPYVQDYIKKFKAKKCEANALVTRSTGRAGAM